MLIFKKKLLRPNQGFFMFHLTLEFSPKIVETMRIHVNPSYPVVLLPMFWGPKTLKPAFFKGSWGPEGDSCCYLDYSRPIPSKWCYVTPNFGVLQKVLRDSLIHLRLFGFFPFLGGDVPYHPLANSRFTNPKCCSVNVSSWLMDTTLGCFI